MSLETLLLKYRKYHKLVYYEFKLMMCSQAKTFKNRQLKTNHQKLSTSFCIIMTAKISRFSFGWQLSESQG